MAATFAQISEIRLTINDPAGFINLIEVATTANLPSAPAQQTSYKVTSSGAYVATEKISGAVASDYTPVDLLVSDVRIDSWVTLVGEDEALLKAINAIISTLGAKLSIVSSSAGAESTTYQDLSKLLQFYKDLYSRYSDDQKKTAGNTTGRVGRAHRPRIAGAH